VHDLLDGAGFNPPRRHQPLSIIIIMKVKFTRDIFVESIPREAGSVADISDKDAIYCIAAGDAIKVVDAKPEKVETATAKQPAKETAAKK
jgi:hypothetical protein